MLKQTLKARKALQALSPKPYFQLSLNPKPYKGTLFSAVPGDRGAPRPKPTAATPSLKQTAGLSWSWVWGFGFRV